MSTVTAATVAAPPRAAQSGDRVFYTGMAVAAALAVLIGFARTFYLRARFEPTPLAPLLVVHGVVFSAWMVLFAAQTSLIAARRAPIHRRLGWAGAGLAAAMVVAALAAAVITGRRDIAAGYETESLAFLATPVLSVGVFALFVAAAVAQRGRPETHKRLMLLATVSILDAAFARWPIAGIAASPLGYYGLTDAFIVAALLYDVVARRSVSAVYVWGGLLIVAGQWAREPLGATAAWQAFARAVLE